MKRSLRKKKGASQPDVLGDLQDGFVRGFVSSGLLVAAGGSADRRQIVRAALQGGTALAAASLAVGAFNRRSLTGVLSAVAAGAASMYMIEQVARAKAASPEN